MFTRFICVDGNFSADHLKQKNPLDDVPLTSGEGMMTNQTRYKSYLAHPIATPQVSTFLTPFCSCGRGRGLPRRMLCGLLLPRASAAAGNHAGHDGRGHHLPRATFPSGHTVGPQGRRLLFVLDFDLAHLFASRSLPAPTIRLSTMQVKIMQVAM